MSVKSRLKSLEKTAREAAAPKWPWASPEVYARLREEVRSEIESDLAIGRESLYWIDDEDNIRAADDGSFVRHLGNYVQAIDREIARLDREIAEEEARMTPEEVAHSRAEFEESYASMDGLTLDEKIGVLEADIALLKAERERGA
jgi:hypothetical protein